MCTAKVCGLGGWGDRDGENCEEVTGEVGVGRQSSHILGSPCQEPAPQLPLPAVACSSAVGQLSNVHVELGDLVGPRLTMQASWSTDRKLLIGIKKTENNQDNDGLGLFNAQTPLQTAEGF